MPPAVEETAARQLHRSLHSAPTLVPVQESRTAYVLLVYLRATLGGNLGLCRRKRTLENIL
jgi:hypothetical protein